MSLLKRLFGKIKEDNIRNIDQGAEATVLPEEETVVYREKTYHTVKIGNQIWLKENLDIGTMIPINKSKTNDGKIAKYYYDTNPKNGEKYGGLYTWDEAMGYSTEEKAQGICPPGWHIPTYDEYMELKAAVAKDGNALKAVGQGTGNGAGTNKSGFTAFLAGFLSPNGNYYGMGQYGIFWTSSSERNNEAVYMSIGDSIPAIDLNKIDRRSCYSVRCIKD